VLLSGLVVNLSLSDPSDGVSLQSRSCTYSDVFHSFVTSSFSGVCLGLYRDSWQPMPNSTAVELPIVITTPDADLEILDSDRVLVLIGTHTLERASSCIQRFYRRYRRRGGQREPSFGFHRSTISKYLGMEEEHDSPVEGIHHSSRGLSKLQSQQSGSTFYV
jgi:hypothetical protein